MEKLGESSSVIPEKRFQNEVANIMAYRHENIVKLVGFCYETEKVVEQNGTHILGDVVVALLCFEYVPNGNLAKYVYGMSWSLHRPTWSEYESSILIKFCTERY